eukprot:1173706-Prorocentrum_minimum.AAC.1
MQPRAPHLCRADALSRPFTSRLLRASAAHKTPPPPKLPPPRSAHPHQPHAAPPPALPLGGVA